MGAPALGELLAALIDDPEAFVAALGEGLTGPAETSHPTVVSHPRPGPAAVPAVRGSLARLVRRPLRRALREGSGSSALWLAARLAQDDRSEIRLLARPCLERSLPDHPEGSWQLMRRLGRRASTPLEVDDLARVWAQGILNETFRWAELEQLPYSEQAMERRLTGATLAVIPRRVSRDERVALQGTASARALTLIRQLMGEAHPSVGRALSWAIREWTRVDPVGAEGLLRDETAIAVERGDGHRAWVIRASLSLQPAIVATGLQERLSGLRRQPGAPSTSRAAMERAPFAAALGRSAGAADRQGERFVRSLA